MNVSDFEAMFLCVYGHFEYVIMLLAGMRAGRVYMSSKCEVLVFSGDLDLLGFSLHLLTVDTHTNNLTHTLGTATLPGEVPLHTLIYTHSLAVVDIQQSMD